MYIGYMMKSLHGLTYINYIYIHESTEMYNFGIKQCDFYTKPAPINGIGLVKR